MKFPESVNASAPASGSPSGLKPPKPLVCRLADLVRELQDSAELFKSQGNDEGYCSTSACAERLHEVVSEFITEAKAWQTRQPQENEKLKRGGD